ncbi:MAG TPA: LamG-like jellyroll fold domain-containing protein [Armatimonadota bacterium]
MFAQDHDETMPNAQSWLTDLSSDYGLDGKVWDCPTTSFKGTEAAPDYIFANAVSSAAIGDIKTPTDEVVLVDGAHEATTYSAGPPMIPATPANVLCKGADVKYRHNNGAVCAFVDGHVSWMRLLPWRYAATVWLDASAGVSTNGALVTSWADQAQTNNATPTAGAEPTLVANVLNKKPVIDFATSGGSSKGLLSTGVVGSSTATAIAVINCRSTNGATGGSAEVSYLCNRTAANAGFEMGCLDAAVGKNQLRTFNAVGQYATNTGQPTALNTWVVVSAVMDTGGSSIYTNGGYRISTQPMAQSTQAIGIGRPTGGSGAKSFDGQIAEVIVLPYAAQGSERQIIEDYLFAKYNLTAAAARQ